MQRLVAVLRSPRLALAVLAYLAAYSAAAAWLPRASPGAPPRLAAALGLDSPFSAWPFLAAVALLFAATLACTWGKRARIRAVARGELPPAAVELGRGGRDARAFLLSRGWRGEGEVLRRFAPALWGGWVLHVGLLVLVLAVLVQQALHDGGAFDLTEGETVRLSDPGALVVRERGPLAPAAAPDLRVTLERFDPFRHEQGYAPDRQGRLRVEREGAPPRIATLDRSAGARAGEVEIFQAIPTGLSVNLAIAGLGTRSIHLRSESERAASAAVSDPAGRPARFTIASGRPLDDRLGTGPLRVELVQDGRAVALAPGARFDFGGREARLVSVGRWGRFTWSRSPGMAGVLAGFAIVVLGCAMLAFPAGVARIGPEGADPAARVFASRGGAALLAEWREERARS